MEQLSEISGLLEQIPCPAFVVQNGIVTYLNYEARELQLQPGTEILPAIRCGNTEYTEFSQGRMCLTLQIDGCVWNASVDRTSEYDIFYLDSAYADTQLRAFALAAQILGDPLSCAMNNTEALLQESVTEESRPYLQSLNRNLHRLHRAICNMSDVADYHNKRTSKIENSELPAFIDTTVQKAQTLLEQNGFTIDYKNTCQSIICYADTEKLERAILNLLSNSAKFCVKGAPICVKLERNGNRLSFCVTNRTSQPAATICKNLFYNFRRAPGLEVLPAGIGLGMAIVRNVMIAHGGTVLVDAPETDTLRITLSIPILRSTENILRTPILYPIDYTGGYDHALTELSDILPPEFFK